jgi:hypothetical protein
MQADKATTPTPATTLLNNFIIVSTSFPALAKNYFYCFATNTFPMLVLSSNLIIVLFTNIVKSYIKFFVTKNKALSVGEGGWTAKVQTGVAQVLVKEVQRKNAKLFKQINS